MYKLLNSKLDLELKKQIRNLHLLSHASKRAELKTKTLNNALHFTKFVQTIQSMIDLSYNETESI